MWKTADVVPIYKKEKDNETDKCNYHPISLFSVPGKLMESIVSSSITSHVIIHYLSNPYQWEYGK